jgi:predicted DNA-binding protein (MmcQ/YjbR family)
MPLSPARVRQLVASLADAQEGAHHGHPDFRVRGKIFATLSEREDRVALRLTHVEARALGERSPSVFRLVSDREPVGWVSALLADADEAEIEDLLEEAWQLRASEVPRARRGRNAPTGQR